MSAPKKIRYGIVGSSSITDQMIAGAKQYDFLELTAVYSRTAARAAEYAKKHGAAYTFTSLSEMAASDIIDMVYIASPNVAHLEQANVFLEKGKHVLCEKPLSAHPQALRETYTLAESKGCLFAEAIILLFQPQLEIFKNAVAKIGDISLAHFDFSQLSSRISAYSAGETPNIFNPALEAGTLQDLGVYCVYPALLLFGKPQSITADASFLTTGADGAGASVWRYADKQVVLTYSKIGQGRAPSQIVGTKGTVTVSSISKLEDITLYLNEKAPQKLWGEEEKPVLMGREIATFAKWIQYRDEAAYAYHRQLALDVCDCMFEMRHKAGIIFPQDNAASRV